jgi:hypothetical protein
MRETIVIGLSLFLAASLAEAQSNLSGENLLVAVPAEYELGYHQKADQGEISEFIPKGESAEAWSEMITVQLLAASNSNAEFYATFESLVKQACPGGSTEVITTTEENGYPTRIFSLSCPANPKTGKGEMTFIKTVEGKDKFYVVQKAWRTEEYKPDQIPLASADVVKWTRYLRSVHVCDNRIKERSCP